jgi:hypothetical protein
MQCKSDPTFHYWKSPANLPAYLAYKTKELNPDTLATAASCLDMLRTAPIGCILLIVQDILPGYPIITLIAAPSMATINTAGSTSNPPGILLADIWAESVLQPFTDNVNLDQPHCPILAASKGFSRDTNLATPQLYLNDAQPMFFPAGELFS